MAHKSLMLDQEKFKRDDEDEDTSDEMPAQDLSGKSVGDLMDEDPQIEGSRSLNSGSIPAIQKLAFGSAPAPKPVNALSESYAQAPNKEEAAPKEPAQDNLSKYLVSEGELKQARDQKRKNSLYGDMADALSNTPSFGDVFLHRTPTKVDAGAGFRANNEQIDQGIKDKGTLLNQELQKPTYNLLKPDSDETKSVKEMAKMKLNLAAQLPFMQNNPQTQGMISNYATMIDKAPNGLAVQKLMEDDKFLGGLMSAGSKSMNSGLAKERIDLSHDRMDQSVHQKTLASLRGNKQLGQRLVQYQNLDNALNNFTSAEHPVYQQFMELQQAVRGNLGIKGSSGVGEREEGYIKSLGLDAQKWKQFLTGDPQDIAKNTPLLKHIQDIARLEQSNVRSQYRKSLNAATKGNASMYERRPDLKGDLEDAIQGNLDQLEEAPKPAGNPANLAEQTGSGAGLVGTSAQAAPPPKRPVSAQELDMYSKKHSVSKDEAKKILIKAGYGVD